MKIKILPSAIADLDRGRAFYARQSKSVSEYFLDSLFADIDSLELYAGVHMKVLGFNRFLASRFPTRFTTGLTPMSASCSECSIADKRQQKQPRL